MTVVANHIHIVRVSETLRVKHYFFPNFGPITTKIGRKMGHGTLTTGKILRSGYLGNGCYGDEKMFSILIVYNHRVEYPSVQLDSIFQL